MGARNCGFVLRLTAEELAHLDAMVARTNLSREEFLRKMIAGYTIVEKPDIDYFEVIRQLRYIGNNLRQMAIRAHALYLIDADRVMQRTDEVIAITNQLAAAVNRHLPPAQKRKEKIQE
ncbi:MAG: ribbon-helix-helix protein, CopG family [Lachnospiraceae bacterium]|nr:ribbon-helix-helix protein, CopG family [Lachnospiraceae bacterium]